MDESYWNTPKARPQALILDMDGVLWRGDEPLVDLALVFQSIRSMGLRVVLATNNSTLTVEQYQAKLAHWGVQLEPEQIITSSLAAARHLHDQFPEGGPVYIVGESGLHNALREKGFWEADNHAIAVVAGLDRQLTYEKIAQASRFILQGAVFIATNTDHALPTPQGLIPGAGAVLAAIQTASGTAPRVIGKPASEMYRVAMKQLGIHPGDTLAVGDRLETDIVGAQAIGCQTALVLSGVATMEMADQWQPPVDYVTSDLMELLEVLQKTYGA
jgi:4-nitrophenyl phosphatase